MRTDSFMSKESNIFELPAVILSSFISIVASRYDVAASILLPTILCRNLLSTDSRLNRIDPSTNIFPPNPERGYRTKFEILLEEVFPNSIE